MIRDGASIEIGGVRAETLLALLAVQAGSPVSADSLVDELWAGEPPEGALTTLRSYISRLRTALGAGASIQRLTGGYVLDVAPDAIDVVRFEALARDGRHLQQRSRHRRASAAFRGALELWRGEPFAGIPAEGTLGGEAARLEELHLNVLEQRLESDLELGMSLELIDELEALVGQHPFRERLWRHLMLALYRAGRQADALGAYHRARRALDEQLGIDPGQDLQSLEAAILRQDVPSPGGMNARSVVGPPSPLTTFIGREHELDEVRALLLRSRLVTLVGVGGVGKTRLSLEAARRAAVDIVDELAFVDLASVSDPSLVPAHTASALGVHERPGEPLDAMLARELGGGDVLLVLDNCEHLRAAAASLARDLLHASPDLRILATSREVLDVPGEAAYPVPPLGVPGPDDDRVAVRASEAVRLLVDRATLTRHGLRVDDSMYETAARICRELDGLPLAIELAAARTKALSLDEIAARLRDRFQFLVSWRRLSAARHRTLREAMDWSFDLLAPEEQGLLARLSVFPAGATLASIAAVCLEGDEQEAERLIERLVDASLLVPSEAGQDTRYRLLETVRQYAAEQLPGPDLEALRRRHAEHVREIAISTNLSLEGAGAAMSFDLARMELPSIRAAIEWASAADPTVGFEIACALERFWVISHAREGIAVFTTLLGSDDIPDLIRARGLRCRGGCRYYLGEFALGVEDYEAALVIHRGLGQHAYEAHLVLRLAIEASRAGDRARARELLDEAAAIGGEHRYAPDRYVGLNLASDLAFDDGRHEDGFVMLRGAIELAATAGDQWWESDFLSRLADRALDLGRLDDAGPAAREALRLSRVINNRLGIIWGLAQLAWEAAASGLGHRAGRIWGGLEAEVERGGPIGQWELEQDTIRARVAALSGDAFHVGVPEGRSLSLDAVVAESLSQS